MKHITLALVIAALLAALGSFVATADSAAPQCRDLATPWTTTWENGALTGPTAFAIDLHSDGELEIHGQSCGPRAAWRAQRICISAPDQVLWIVSTAPTVALQWQTPYPPDQIAVYGSCVALRPTWLPFVHSNAPCCAHDG